MDNSNLCNSLIKWLHTFPGLSDVTASSLSDGVQLAKALNIIAPDFFSHQWLSKIKTDVESNWRLKVSNLSKVHQGVVDFYTDHVGTSVQHLKSPDLKKIGEHSDEVELGHLLQLLLGCAINCNDKQRHIEAIMSMEENVQAVIVNAIQDLMSREGSPGVESTGPFSEGLPSYHPHLKSLMEQLESTSIAKEEMDRRCNELDHQISVLVEERNFYKGENEKLKDRVDILEKGSDVGSTRYADLRKQIESLQDELYKVETTRDEYRGRLDELEKIVPDLTTKNEELLLLAEEARSLKDEVDALRGVNDKVGEYEATIETFKRRQEEFSDLRRQVKILEEKNSNYMQNNLELEEEVKKSTALRPQVDLLRKQVTDLHNKLSEETKDKDKLTFDLKKMSEKFEAAVHERDRIQSERFELQKNLEDLKCLSTADSATKSQSDLEDIDPLEILSPAVREKLIRLEHENRSLKKKVSENTDESNPVLQSMFNDLQERFDLLQRENRHTHLKIIELENEIEENTLLTPKQQDISTSSSSEVSSLKHKILEQSNQIATMEEALAKKDNDMCAMEERYKKYLSKAKSVIKSLDPKTTGGVLPDVSVLRAQLSEKDIIIDNLEKETQKNNNVREMEERLITTAFFNYGLQLHRNMITQRLAALDQGNQGFMSRQRQSSQRRTMGGNSSLYYE